MLERARLLSFVVAIFANAAVAQTLDPSSYTLTNAAADKFVRVTQQMIASGAQGPSMQGGAGGGMDLARIKAQMDQSPPAQQALSAAGMSSTDYVLFLGAAMQSMMIGQMEAAGMRGMLPPGVTSRPPQTNIDFMKQNMDLFQRSMTPGASAASARPTRGADDEALPVPRDAAAVLPSSIFARVPAITAIKSGTDCSLGGLSATITTENEKAHTLQAGYYGNPGDAGLARTPAEGAVLERAGDSELYACGQNIIMRLDPTGARQRAEEERSNAIGAIVREQEAAWNACPGIPGGKEPACERQVNQAAARKTHAAELAYLQTIAPSFASTAQQMKECTVLRESVVVDAKAADVRGANVKEVLQALVLAWELPAYALELWSGTCETSQRYLLKE